MPAKGKTSWCGCWELNWSPLLLNHFFNHSMTSFELLSQLAFIIFDSLSSNISWDTLPSYQGFKIDLTFMLVHGRTGKRFVSSCPLVHVTRYFPNVLIHSLPFREEHFYPYRSCCLFWFKCLVQGKSHFLNPPWVEGPVLVYFILSVKVSTWKLS